MNFGPGIISLHRIVALIFPLFLVLLSASIFASPLEMDILYDTFKVLVLSSNCYPTLSMSSDIPSLEFETSVSNEKIFKAFNILSNDVSLLEEAFAKGVNFNVPFLPDQFPIHFSILSDGRREMFDLLVGKVDVNQAGLDGLTPLHYALQEGNFYFIENLLKNGADPHKKALLEWDAIVVEGRSFVEQSFYMENITEEFINLMMSNFAKYWRSFKVIYKKAIEARNELLMIEIAKIIDPSDIKLILDLYCDIQEFPLVKEYFLESFEIEKMIQELIGETSIYEACQSGNLLAVKVLILLCGSDIEGLNQLNRTPLQIASLKGYYEIVEFLVDHRCIIDSYDNLNYSALQLAFFSNQTNVVQFLIRKGGNFNHADDLGDTLLIFASSSGDLRIVKMLLEMGCEVDQANASGHTSLIYACENGLIHIARFLLANGANINHASESGKTALIAASTEGHKLVVDLLIENRCDITFADTKNKTALIYAINNGHNEIAEKLRLLS